MAEPIPILKVPEADDERAVIPYGDPKYFDPKYNPNPPAAPGTPQYSPPAAATPATPQGAEMSASRQDAVAYLQGLLDDYGLGTLSGWAYDQVVAGNSPEMVLQMLRKTPEYQQRFHVIFDRQRKGLAAISPAEVIAYERQARQLMMRAGLPPGFYDQTSDFDALLTSDVSLAELADRIEVGRTFLYQTDPTARAEFTRLYGEGNLLAMTLDPDAAMPLITKQFASGQLSAAGVRSGFGGLSRDEAERMYEMGTDTAEASSGFGTLVASKELFDSLPGEGADAIGREAQLAAAFGGDAAQQQRIERRGRTRRAAFEGGGRYNSTQEGFGGLGSVT